MANDGLMIGLDVSSTDGFVGLAFVTPAGTFRTELTTEMADDLAKRLQAGAQVGRNAMRCNVRSKP